MEQIQYDNESTISLKELWMLFISNIWLFVISIFICGSIAVGYLLITPSKYERTASIIIKDDRKNSFYGLDAFDSMGIMQPNSDITNEIHVLSTAPVMEEVVKRLSLNYNYYRRVNGLKWIDLYGASPIEVTLDEQLEKSSIGFILKVVDDNHFRLSEMRIDIEDEFEEIEGTFGESVMTPYGSFTVNRNELFIAKPVEGEEEEFVDTFVDGKFRFTKGDIAPTADAYMGAISIILRDKDSSVIDMSLVSESAQKAEDVLNTLILVYNENWIKDKNLVTINTTDFINDRLLIIQEELGIVDEEISEYKSRNLLPDLATVAGMNLETSSQLLKHQIELANQLSMARYIISYIEEPGSSERLLPVNSGIGSTTIENQIIKYNEMFLQKNTLLANSSINHPLVADLTSQLVAMRDMLILSINDYISTLEIQIENARKEELKTQSKISNTPSQELYLLSTGREQKVKEALYLFLLQRREENELSQAFTAYNTRILNYARGTSAPVQPRKMIVLLLGLIIGGCIPCAFLFIRESLKTEVESKDDLKGLAVPYLGTIPAIRKSKMPFAKKGPEIPKSQIVVSATKRDIPNEAFRVIRTNLDFMLSSFEDNKCRKIIFTSYNPGSGKSFIALNLSHSMALKDCRVLIVDADFRRGTLSKCVDSPKRGAVNYISGNAPLSELICKSPENPNLDILPMGATPPNPTELLLNKRFPEMIKELEAQYDYIFFDCPPFEIIPDAAIIEKYCDITIFVIRAGLMDKNLLPELDILYNSNRIKRMSLLLNDVDYGKRDTYGKYGYGYGYGKRQHYGYGNE